MNACEMNTNAQKIIDDAMQLEARVRALVAETRLESLGLSAAFQVIEQRDHGQEIRDQADDLLAQWSAQVDPRQRLGDRKVEAPAPALGQLLGNGGRDSDPRDQLR
jgi:hypothetical protein